MIAYKEDGVWFSGSAGSYIGYTLGGDAIGAIAGLLSSAALVGRFTASCGAVKSGVVTLYNMIKFGGLGAVSCMIYDNLKKFGSLYNTCFLVRWRIIYEWWKLFIIGYWWNNAWND